MVVFYGQIIAIDGQGPVSFIRKLLLLMDKEGNIMIKKDWTAMLFHMHMEFQLYAFDERVAMFSF
jgi:hypothetical protein